MKLEVTRRYAKLKVCKTVEGKDKEKIMYKSHAFINHETHWGRYC